MSNRIYPFDLPGNIHPLAWTLLGFGLDSKTMSALARHLFDKLGARVDLEDQESVTVSFAVDWARDPEGRQVASVGDEIDQVISESGAVELVAGHLPPGVRLQRHTGRIVGTITAPGLYAATFAVGPRVKYDPLGGNGTPDSPGIWIGINEPRREPITRLADFPVTVADLNEAEKSRLLAELQAWQNGQVAKEADSGN